MRIEDMTPEELREYAARKEAVELHRAHIGPEGAGAVADPEPPAERQPWEREVEVDGVTYVVDMRPFRSREFMRMALEARGHEDDASFGIRLFDMCFGPIEDQILAEVERRVGYEDFSVYYEICGRIFEAVEAKN